MIERLFAFFDEDNEFKEVWELKLIKFDIDLDDQVKQYERYLAVSHTVQDVKGNPGMRGHYHVTNLRIIWHGAIDRDINLSIGNQQINILYKLGLDTITHVSIKPIILGSNGMIKNILLIKTQSPKGNKYEFKFGIHTDRELHVFKKVIEVHKQAVQSKMYRQICTNLKINYESMKFQTLPKQQIINKYTEGKFYQQNRVFDCEIVLTNVRIVILMTSQSKGISYGIPWIMIQSFEKATHWDNEVMMLQIRGLLSNKDIFVKTNKNFNKFESEFRSLSITYSKNPILGIDTSNSIPKDSTESVEEKKKFEIEQTFQTKINIKRTKKTYQSVNNTKGNIEDTFFNEQLGIMMQKLPEGATRSSLWEILG